MNKILQVCKCAHHASNDFPNERLIQHKNEAQRSKYVSFKITENENHYPDFAPKLVSFKTNIHNLILGTDLLHQDSFTN